jgi:hypothetical protein
LAVLKNVIKLHLLKLVIGKFNIFFFNKYISF